MVKLNWTSGLTTLSKNSKISLTDTTVMMSDVAENGGNSKNLIPFFLLIVFVVIALVFSSRGDEKKGGSKGTKGGTADLSGSP